MNCTLHFDDRNGVRVVPLAGEFDLSVAPLLESFLTIALADSKPVIIDLSEATYVDSTILSILVRKKNRAGEQIVIVVPKGARLRRIFEITNLATGLGVAENVAEAAARLGEDPGEPRSQSNGNALRK